MEDLVAGGSEISHGKPLFLSVADGKYHQPYRAANEQDAPTNHRSYSHWTQVSRSFRLDIGRQCIGRLLIFNRIPLNFDKIQTRMSASVMLQVLLHDPKEEPMMLERGFRVSPGFVTQIAVTANYVSQQAINRQCQPTKY